MAVSATNTCTYCIHSHTAAARQKGMTDAQYAHFLQIVGMAAQTNALVTAMQIPVDEAFQVGH
jgi:AhpD family alkylhydroperoxidase